MRAKNYIGFKSLEGLLWWIDDVTRADLSQCTMWWIAEGEYPYLVHATQELTQAALNEVKQKKKSRDVRHGVVKLKEPPSATHQSTLDQLWRYARPYRSRGSQTPDYWLFIVETMREDTYREISTSLRLNGELVIGSTSPLIDEGASAPSREPERFTAIRSSGTDANQLAHRTLSGVTPIAVFENRFENSLVTSALPLGWNPPRLPDGCWPTDSLQLWYRDLSTRHHVLWALKIEREGPSLIQLIRWVRPPAQSASGISPSEIVSDVSSETPQYKVQVKRRPPHLALDASLGARETRSFVFRLRSQGDEFSAMLVRVINQLESLKLPPKILYAALDWDESYDAPERWHFLYVEHMTGDKLSAWRLLERFEPNEELSRFNLPHVYVDSSSQVSPPLELLIDPSSDKSLENLSQMLSMPSDDHITLVEAMPENPTKPLITQIKISEMRPLAELIVELTEGWNGAELKRATALNLAPKQLEKWRAETKRHLSDIVTLEHEALARANREALAVLKTESSRAIDAMRTASGPVVESTELSEALTERIIAADANYERVCGGLAEVSRELTSPRRSWISEETRRTGKALERFAPVLRDLNSVRNQTEETTTTLRQRGETLTNARHEVARRRESWLEQQRLSEQIATDAREQLSLLEETARQATQRINTARAVTAEQQREAERVYREVKKREAKLLKERRAVEALEAENRRIHQKNENDEAELTRRREAGEAEKLRVIHRRDVEIPELRREVTSLEAEVKRLNPSRVDREFNAASAAKQTSARKLKEMEERLAETQRLIAEKEREIRETDELRADYLRDNERLKSEITAARELNTTIQSLKRERKTIEGTLRSLNPSKLQREHSSLDAEISQITAEVESAHETQRLIKEQERELAALEPKLQRVQELRSQLDQQTQELKNKRKEKLSFRDRIALFLSRK